MLWFTQIHGEAEKLGKVWFAIFQNPGRQSTFNGPPIADIARSCLRVYYGRRSVYSLLLSCGLNHLLFILLQSKQVSTPLHFVAPTVAFTMDRVSMKLIMLSMKISQTFRDTKTSTPLRFLTFLTSKVQFFTMIPLVLLAFPLSMRPSTLFDTVL